MQNKLDVEALRQMQRLGLEAKISMSVLRIREWIDEYGSDGVYVSFSGGKDSTALLHLIRTQFPYYDIPAVFIDTGLEYPEIKEFVKTVDNVTVVRPEMNFRQVIKKYGYPFFSKTIAHNVSVARRNPNGNVKKNIFNPNKTGPYAMFKWSFLLEKEAPYISEKCCDVMKKKPAHVYQNQTGRLPFIGTLAEESRLRLDQWCKFGCNVFEGSHKASHPLSFWTNQDILQYLKKYQVPYAPIYGEIIQDDNGKLKTTGAQRTGCIFCGFGVHLEREPNRWQQLKRTYPNIYDYIIRPWNEGGLGIKDVVEYIEGNSNVKIPLE